MGKQKIETEFGIFGNAALEAYSTIIHYKADYLDAWNNAIINYTSSKSSRKKPCPRSTFFDLCNAGFLKGIYSDNLIPIGKNGCYAFEAIGILIANNGNPKNPMQLWNRLTSNLGENGIDRKSYNYQIHVVLALWNAGKISPNSNNTQPSPPKVPIVPGKPTLPSKPSQNGQPITFVVQLVKTYYEEGFFNVSVRYQNLFDDHGQPITIHFGNNTWNDTINRTANRNGTPRIFGKIKLRDWFQANFKLNDMIAVEMINQNTIRIH